MSAMNGQAWATAESFEPMDATNEHDFGNLIDFDHLDLDFNIAGYAQGDAQNDGQQLPDLAGPLDGHHMQDHYAAQLIQQHRDGPSSGQQSQSNSSFNFDYGMAPYSQAGTPTFSQTQEHMYRPHQGVPPTPNSVEMHGDPHHYMHQLDPQQALFEQTYHMRKDDASFTPLVSPAVTPHDARFQIPDFTVPGAYFSPLTSPALNAQNQQHAHHQSQTTASGSSTGHSPIDVDMDILGEPALMQHDTARKLRSTTKKTTRVTNSNNRVRQSPIVKPGRRKGTVSSIIPPKEVSELMQEARGGRPSTSGHDVPRACDGSETDSISPEPSLSEMPPPPLPGSVTHSPAMVAQQNGSCATPATPASLMRIQPSPTYGGSNEAPPMMEDLILPEPSLERPSLSQLDTTLHDTPRLSARKTPKLNPPSTSSGGISSPMMDPKSTPTSPAFSMTNGRKPDSKLARNPKKRNSTSSTLVSPALRPKISPSIKPLLPEGSSSTADSTHALLLASKSNYQNILDGTTIPGMFPTSLATNLSSKRTSHKIAEQGRRNRINMALQEMQALLPASQSPVAEAKSGDDTTAQSNNSKAAKVESAIEYIKALQQQVSEKERVIEAKEVEMEQLRKELAAMRRSSSVGSTVEATASLKTEHTTSPTMNDGT